MNHEQVLVSLKFIRNTFDTIGVECGVSSRYTIDKWAEVLLTGDESEVIPFAHCIQDTTNAIQSLLYSINKVAKDFLTPHVDFPEDKAQTTQETTEIQKGDDL